jgi:hypothetical protein
MPSNAGGQAGSALEYASKQATLICVGNDEALLSYRGQVLTQAGFQVISARPHLNQPAQFTNLCRLHGAALVVACHTLTSQQRIGLSRELRQSCPHVKLLALTNGVLPPEEATAYDLVLDSLDGPAALIAMVRAHI